MSDRFAYPEGIDPAAFIEYGDCGGFYCAPGTLEPSVMVQGVLAYMVQQCGPEETAEYLSKPVLAWYDNDEDKPDDVYHAEVHAAFHKEYEGSVRHGLAVFFEPGDPECPWGTDGGVLVGGDADESAKAIASTWLDMQ